MNQKLQLPVKLASILILIALLAAPGVGWGQTAPGHIAFLAANVDGEDDFAFVTLVDIPAGTNIYFTDNEWNGTAFSDLNEGELTWTNGGTTLTAGSVVVFTDPLGSGSVNVGSFTGSNWNLGASDEWFYALLSPPATSYETTPVFLAAMANDAGTGWLTGTGLTEGTNAIDFNDDSDGYKYTGSRSGQASFQDYLSLIMNPINWQIESSDGELILPISTTSFTITGGSNPTITVAPATLSGFTYALGAGPSAEQSFSVSGSNLTSNVSIDAPTNYEISTGTGVSFSAADPISLTPSSGTLNETTIYVRLKSGLDEGEYNNEVITAASSDADNKTVTCSGSVSAPPSITFYFRGPSWMNNNPHNPEIWGPYNGWSTPPAMVLDGVTGWWSVTVEVADPTASIEYQSRFSQDGTTKYQKASGNFGANATFTTTTGEIWIDASNNSSFTWQGDDFYLAEEKITESEPVPTVPQIDWCNVQSPATGTITAGGDYDVYARVYMSFVTEPAGQGASISAWIGFSTTNTDPSTWENWVVATYNGDVGNNDEYMANIGAALTPGTYYYASRFQRSTLDFVYGGYSEAGGHFWDGVDFVSGVLTVNAPPMPNAWINEFHYDNAGTDVGEFVEVVIENAGDYSRSDFHLYLINGENGLYYNDISLLSFGYGESYLGENDSIFTFYAYNFPSNGIQNGGPDGLALTYKGVLIPGQFLSYEGEFTGAGWPVDGVVSTDIGVSQSNSTPINYSLQLCGTGTSYSDFTWYLKNFSLPGYLNQDQSFFGSTEWTAGNATSQWGAPPNWSNGLPVSASTVTIPPASIDPIIQYSEHGKCDVLTIESGAVLTIGATGMLSVNSSLDIIGNININDGGSLITNGTVTGTATVQKNISDSDFHLFTLPVNQPLPASPTFIGYYVDDYIEANGAWTRMVDADNLQPLRGYSISNESGALSLDFSGPLFSGNQTFSNLSYTPAAGGYQFGWNLVGNPFPSAIDMDVAALTATGLNGFAYVWTGTNYVSGPLAGGAGTLAGNIIPSAQGFFVRTEAAGANLTIPNAARVHSTQSFYKRSETFENTIMLTASGNGAEDRMMFAVNPEATAGYDSNFDAYKLFGNADAPQLYTKAGDLNLSISSVDVIEAETEFPVMFKAGVDGNYTITSSYPESFMSGSQIILTDNLTGLRQDLRQNPVYAFSAAAGDDANRFKLSFATVGIEEPSGLNIGVYAAGSQIRLVLPELMKGMVNISNLAGQLLYSQNFNGSGELGIGASYPAGVYLVTVISANGSTTRKVFVN